jgi:hypothetical protein
MCPDKQTRKCVDHYEKERDNTRTGLTKFKYKWKRRFRYTYKYRTQEDKVYLNITVRATVDPNISHRIYMPYNNRDKPWYPRLLAHEYDHVCISLDERPRLLLQHLASHFKISDIQVNSKEEITKSFISSQVNMRLDAYENAIEELVRNNYKLLDHIDVSNHGKKLIPNRKVFFQGLYTRDNLAKHKFKYITEVATLLKSKEYKNAKIYYTFNTKKRKLKGVVP